jgi:flagellar biosynthesis/type III secretory pathway protein FliH
MGELHLSDAFLQPVDKPALDLVCTVYNINKGKNKELMQNCKVLRDYAYFVEKVRDKSAEGKPLEDAISEAIDECIRLNVLEDFLRERRSEVMRAMTLDYTWERREKLIREEERQEGYDLGREDGLSQGLSQGIAQGRIANLLEQVCKKLRRQKTVLQIADELEENEETISAMCRVAERFVVIYCSCNTSGL